MVSEDIGRQVAIDEIVGNAGELNLGKDEFSGKFTATSDEKVTIYSMQTGSPKQILKIDAARVLKKKFPNGKYMHWIEGMPDKPPEFVEGTIKCMLHPDFDELEGASGIDRAFVDEAGLQNMYCNQMAVDKNNRADFPTVYGRDAHMASRHQKEWAAIKSAIELRDRNRERDEHRMDREAMMAVVKANKPK